MCIISSKCWQPQIFYICKLYLFFHIYNPLSIPSFDSHMFLANAYEVFTAIHNHFTFGSCIFKSMTTYRFLIWQTYFFFLIWNCTECVYIQSTNAHEVWSRQPQIFDICKLCLFLIIYDPFSIPYLVVVFVFLQNAYEVFTVIYKHFTLKLYTHVYINKILMCIKCSVDSLNILYL